MGTGLRHAVPHNAYRMNLGGVAQACSEVGDALQPQPEVLMPGSASPLRPRKPPSLDHFVELRRCLGQGLLVQDERRFPLRALEGKNKGQSPMALASA